MFSFKRFKRIFIISSLFTLSLGIYTNHNVFASSVDDDYLDKLYLTNDVPQEERIEYLKSALDPNNKDVETVTVSELNLCESIDSSSKTLTQQDNSKVKEYLNTIEELSQKSEAQLKNFGFNEKRLQAMDTFKELTKTVDVDNYSNNPAIIMAAQNAGATCDLYLRTDQYYYNHSFQGRNYKTLIYLSSGWSWNACPVFGYDDAFAVSWHAATNLQVCMTNSGAEYYAIPGQKYLRGEDCSNAAWNNRPDSLNGIIFKFKMANTDGKRFYEFAKTGYSMNALMSTDFNVSSFTANAKYAHSYTDLSPSLSISVNGGIDLGSVYSTVSDDFGKSGTFYKSDY